MIDSPTSLPNLRPTAAADIAAGAGMSAAAQGVAAAAPSAPQALSALVENRMFLDAAVALSQGLTKESAVKWAIESARLVAAKLPSEELDAMAGAEAWLSSGGSAADQLEPALAATGMQGPGAWAAQAAQWAGGDAVGPLGGQSAPLYPAAVLGAVKLAAALVAQDWPLAPGAAPRPPEGVSPAGFMGLADAFPGIGDLPPLEAQQSASAALNDLLEPLVNLGLRIAAESLA